MTDTQIAHDSAHAADSHDPHGHDSHGHDDPNAAPLRSDVRETFPAAAVLFCALVGAVAIIAGTLIGLTVVNN